MEVEWDPTKNQGNILTHRIDVADAITMFEDPYRLELDTTRPEHGEERTKAIGRMDHLLIVVIFTVRRGRRRIISARRASQDERRTYRQGAPSD